MKEDPTPEMEDQEKVVEDGEQEEVVEDGE